MRNNAGSVVVTTGPLRLFPSYRFIRISFEFVITPLEIRDVCDNLQRALDFDAAVAEGAVLAWFRNNSQTAVMPVGFLKSTISHYVLISTKEGPFGSMKVCGWARAVTLRTGVLCG